MPIQSPVAAFDAAIAKAMNAEACWQALEALSAAAGAHKLFTIMTVDLAANLASRVYTSNPAFYPVSGTKPIHRDAWFEIVHGEKRSFIANTIEDIAKVFPDHATIAALGLGSVINLPVVLRGVLMATVNLLHEAGHYTPARVATIEAALSVPAKLALLAARMPQ